MKRIWTRSFTVDDLNQRSRKTMLEHLGIAFTEAGDDFLRAEMPVDERTHQPLGLLHGGANVALAESIMSTAGNLVLQDAQEYCVGLEINANHLRPATSGRVVGTCRAIHIGRSTQVWETVIEQDGKKICVSRMTLAVLKRK